jgi:hypothetical protein
VPSGKADPPQTVFSSPVRVFRLSRKKANLAKRGFFGRFDFFFWPKRVPGLFRRMATTAPVFFLA